jgi:ABC-type branched-subunit amino acid transport system substrate-binding protein
MTVAGCTSILGISSDPKVEKPVTNCQGTVYVRIATDFSGTATDIAIPHFWGIYDYLRNLNENGGIRGCQIDMNVQDNNYTPAKTTDVVNGWRNNDPHWKDVSTLFIFGTGPTTAVGPTIMTEKKVIIPGSYAGSLASPAPIKKDVPYTVLNPQYQAAQFDENKASPGWPYIFFPATDYGTAIRLAIQAAWTISPGRVALAHDTADKCAYCVDPLAAGASFIPSLQGMSLGRDLIIPQTSNPADAAKIHTAVDTYFNDPTTGEIAHFKTANATSYAYDPVVWVWSGNSVYASAILAKEIAAVQAAIDKDTAIQAILTANKKTWKVRVMANNWGIGETTTTICGADCNTDVIYGLFPVPRYADLQNSTGMAQLIALHDHYGDQDGKTPPPSPITPRKLDDYRDVRYVQGYTAAAMWAKAMSAAIDKGSSNPTGEDIKNALESFKELDLEGLTAGPISFTGADHRPQSNESIYKVDANGTLAFVNKFSVALVPDWLGY